MMNRQKWSLTAGVFLVMSFASNSFLSAAKSPAPPEKVRTVEGITEYSLENGMKVLLFPDPSSPKVTVNLTILVGSRHEGYGETGMAHLLEHMLFKGTPTHKNIPKELQARGAQFNGTTWFDRTNYYETLPASEDNLEFALKMEADRMMNSYVKAEDLASEMTVVRNEFERGENSPSRMLMQKVMGSAFEWHNYGKSTIGNRADIERVPIDRLKKFYKKYYQPDNAVLIVAGKFDQTEALKLINQYFGTIPRPERKLDSTYTEEPPQEGERVVTLRRVGEVPVVGVVYHIPAAAHKDMAALDVLESALTSDPSGVLYQALVKTKKASSVSGSIFALHDPGVLRLIVEVVKGNDPQVILGIMFDTLQTVIDKGISPEDVTRAKEKLLKQYEQAENNSSRLAVELSEWVAMGDWRLRFLYRDALEKVTPADVKRVADLYLKENNRTVGIFVPVDKSEKVSIPQVNDIAKMIGDYKGRETVAMGEDFDVSPENIDKRTTVKTLSSGVKVALLSKKTRGEEVNLKMTLRYGNLVNLNGKRLACEFLPVVMKRGTKKMTRQEIEDALNKLRAQLSISGSPGQITVGIKTRSENLGKVLDILKDILREPTLPESELEVLKTQQIAMLEKQKTDPQSRAILSVRRQLRPYSVEDPRYVPDIDQEIKRIKALTQSDLQSLYENFIGASVGEIAVVGDFAEDQTFSQLNSMLENWESKAAYKHIPAMAHQIPGNLTEIIIPDKANAFYFAGLTFPMNTSSPDYPDLIVAGSVLGSSGLSSRLGDRVRQKEGLAYGVGAFIHADSIDERGSISIYASCNPANMNKVEVAIKEELTLLSSKGITKEELANAQKGYLEQQEVSRTNDSSLASILTANLFAKRDMKYYSELEKKINAVTAEAAQQAFAKYIHPENLIITVSGSLTD
ncbi:M16 family metallopeptidase [Gimesia aquarii]|uniref:Protease 3 n=1 Tax=Gimesia aquarii TaxID=2527964 RepID=A0A517VXC3_9PLAN|nr:pitrilysin family protein [Gimesia aquarii]QDT97652.1 Protease 3 precursor [Gimesia aquarii]